MNSSINKKGHTQVDHISYDDILPTLSPAAQLIYLRIYRQTIGWKKPTDQISLSQFRKLTGYKKNDTILHAIGELEERDLIIVTRETTRVNSYEINLETLLTYLNNG